MKIIFNILSLLLPLITLPACGGSSSSDPDAFIRVLHANELLGDVNIKVIPEEDREGVLDFRGIGFKESTGYTSISSGQAVVNIAVVNIQDINLDEGITENTIFTFSGGGSYTIFLSSSDPAKPAVSALVDERFVAAGGRVRMRVIHNSPYTNSPDTGTAVDVYVLEPSKNILNATPLVQSIDFGEVTAYAEFTGGNYRIVVTPTGGKDTLFQLGPLNLDPGQVRTLIMVDAPLGGAPGELLLLNDLR